MGRVSAWEALLLGVVEGLTEFLPVSSTGHLTLLFHLLGLPVEEDPFLKTFLVAIQLGAILAVLLLYGRRLAADRALWLRIAVAFVPTGVIGFLFYPLIKGVILGNDAVVAFFLFFVGAVLLFADRLASDGINVYEIRPGVIATDMTGGVKEKYDKLIITDERGITPIRRWGKAEDVGRAVRAIAEDRFPFSTGACFDVDGGFHLQRL